MVYNRTQASRFQKTLKNLKFEINKIKSKATSYQKAIFLKIKVSKVKNKIWMINAKSQARM